MSFSRPVKHAGALALYGALLLLLALSAPSWPDDWDGLGFLASETRFDLDRFAPHPPGYPVYVALLRVAHSFIRDPLTAASVVAIASALAWVALLSDAARRALPSRGQVPVALAACLTPLAWREATAVGSEAPALAFAALGAWGLAVAHQGKAWGGVAVGVAVGLGLGVRISWAPLYLPMMLLVSCGMRARAWAAAAASVLAWVVPMLAVVGPAHLVELLRAHFHGHAERWGGTMITEPGIGRLGWLFRDTVVDGLGAGEDALGLAIGCLAAVLAAFGLIEWARGGLRGLRVAMLIVVPYVVWVAIGQNLHQQPRHVVPVVVALAMGLAVAATTTRRAAVVGGVLALVVGARTAQDAASRRSTPPSGAQALEFVQALPEPRDAAFFGGPSARFFEPTDLADRAATCGSLGDVMVALGRMNDLPRRVFVTDELEGRALAEPPLDEVATFCRPARLDRRAPCLTVYEWKLPLLAR